MDALLKFPDKATSMQFRAAFSGQAIDSEDDTPPRINGVNIHVIGTHYVQDGVTQDGGGNDVPIMAAVDGWWLLIRVADDFNILTALANFPESLHPEIPWVSQDSEGEQVERPTELPQVRWA